MQHLPTRNGYRCTGIYTGGRLSRCPNPESPHASEYEPETGKTPYTLPHHACRLNAPTIRRPGILSLQGSSTGRFSRAGRWAMCTATAARNRYDLLLKKAIRSLVFVRQSTSPHAAESILQFLTVRS